MPYLHNAGNREEGSWSDKVSWSPQGIYPLVEMWLAQWAGKEGGHWKCALSLLDPNCISEIICQIYKDGEDGPCYAMETSVSVYLTTFQAGQNLGSCIYE